jgi:hypothetical protein
VVFPKGWKKINKGWKKMGAIEKVYDSPDFYLNLQYYK